MSFALKKSWIHAVALFAAGTVCAAEAPDAIVSQHRAGMVVDGKADDWAGIEFVHVTVSNCVLDAGTKPVLTDDDLSFRFAVAHDDEALYVAVDVTDDALCADSCLPDSIAAPAWDDDAVEVFIDGNHNRAHDSRANNGAELRWGGEFGLVANGAAMSDFSGFPESFGTLWQGATNYASVTNGAATNMFYEFRLPWHVMGQTNMPETIGFNISVQDDDDGVRRDHAMYWKGNPKRPFSDESAFGTLIFAPRDAGTTRPEN